MLAQQRFEFSPVLCMEICGYMMECMAVGDILVDLNLGLQSILGYMVGPQCVCSAMAPPQQQQQQQHGDESCDDDLLLEVINFVVLILSVYFRDFCLELRKIYL